MRTKILGTAVAALVLTASAYANVMLLSGNNQQPNEENIMFFVSPLFGSSGNNFMTVNATGGGEITITPTSGLMTLAQNQISGISITSVVPESSSMLLVGSGLLLLALGLRRKLL